MEGEVTEKNNSGFKNAWEVQIKPRTKYFGEKEWENVGTTSFKDPFIASRPNLDEGRENKENTESLQ